MACDPFEYLHLPINGVGEIMGSNPPQVIMSRNNYEDSLLLFTFTSQRDRNLVYTQSPLYFFPLLSILQPSSLSHDDNLGPLLATIIWHAEHTSSHL